MIIDLILDRKDGLEYDARSFYDMVSDYEGYNMGSKGTISRAMDEGEEKDVKRELCVYIDNNGYNPAIKDYINSVSWL